VWWFSARDLIIIAGGCLGLWQKQGIGFQYEGVALRNGSFSLMEGSLCAH